MNKSLISKSLSSLFFIILILYFVYCGITYITFYVACQNMDNYNMQEFMRVQVFGSTDSSERETISTNFSIINSLGNEIASVDRSWNNRYLSINFVQVTFGNKRFIFPQNVYGKDYIMDNPSFNKKVTPLEKYYNENHLCLLLGSNYSQLERRNLYIISKFANTKFPIFKLGMVSSVNLDLSECRNGVFYSVCLNQKGKLVVVEL